MAGAAPDTPQIRAICDGADMQLTDHLQPIRQAGGVVKLADDVARRERALQRMLSTLGEG